MRHSLSSFSVILLLAAVSAACSSTLTSPSTVSTISTAAQLEGTWTLASIQPAGAAIQNRPADATYTVSISDNRLSTRADCNSCAGSISIEGNTLTAGPALACTRAACPTMAFEGSYTALLSGENTVVVNGSTLTLSSPRGTLRFVRN